MHLVPLTNQELRGLEESFEEEITCWREQLHWDYKPSVDLIKQFVITRNLPGFVLRNSSQKTLGYTYYIANDPVGFIGGLFVRRRFSSTKAYRMLLQEAFRALTRWPRVSRVECQIFPFNLDLAPLFLEIGFQAMERLYLTHALEGTLPAMASANDLPFRIRPWNRTVLEEAAGVIYDSYAGAPDYELCFDYQSPEGCIRFLRNLVDNPGCGEFDPQGSLMAFEKGGGLCGLLVTTRISPQSGMIPQISVLRRCQDQGVGTALLARYFDIARQQGLDRVALSVSKANQGALRLYQRLGFGQARRFFAFVWRAKKRR